MMDWDLYLIRFRTTKGYILQISMLCFHKNHPITIVKKINHSWFEQDKIIQICNDHNNHKNDVEYQDALLRANGFSDKKAS